MKPLSDALGISVGELLSGERLVQLPEAKASADTVILETMESAGKKVKRIGSFCVALIGMMLSIGIFFLIQWLSEPSGVEFINGSQTYMHYSLREIDGSLTYEAFEKREISQGYEYCSTDGAARYVFLRQSENTEPVLAYMHRSGEGMLFGFPIGRDTVIQANDTLGIEKTSLRSYLEENGFQWHHITEDFGCPSLVYIDGVRCNWYVYEKDGVFVSFCISAGEGCRLYAYDIGLSNETVKPILSELLDTVEIQATSQSKK